MDKDKNIFEAAAKKLTHLKKNEEPSPKEAKKKEKPAPAAPAYQDPEVNDMMQQIQEMNLDLQKQMDLISKKSGLSHEDLQKMIENPDHFNLNVESLKKGKMVLGDRLQGILSGGKKGDKSDTKPVSNDPTSTDRKSKTLGARKKWIPMR